MHNRHGFLAECHVNTFCVYLLRHFHDPTYPTKMVDWLPQHQTSSAHFLPIIVDCSTYRTTRCGRHPSREENSSSCSRPKYHRCSLVRKQQNRVTDCLFYLLLPLQLVSVRKLIQPLDHKFVHPPLALPTWPIVVK